MGASPFDFIADPSQPHPIDILEPEDQIDVDDDDIAKLGTYDPEVIATLMRVLFVPNLRSGFNPRTILLRCIALAHCLHIQPIGGKSLTELADAIGCTRSLLCWYVVRLRDFGKLDHHAGKSDTARERQAIAKLWHGSRNRRRGRSKSDDEATSAINEDAVSR